MLKKVCCAFMLVGVVSAGHGQLVFTPDYGTIVNIGTTPQAMPWTGGLNFCQFSSIDLDQDNVKDLFVFDRTGDKVLTFLNGGAPNTVSYTYAPQFENKFPDMTGWAILVDYNCDGKEDILTYASPIAGIKVWRNESTIATGLKFTLAKDYIRSNYNPSVANLYVSQVDIPSMTDIDGDGDLDIMTFDFSGSFVEYHKNLSKENGFNCDSLIFQLDVNGCWGNFSENPSNCSINLNQSCRMSYPHPAPPLTDVSNGHSGSCSLCLDMDADGDKDLLIGDISCCNMTLMTNGGSSMTANMTAFEDSFPSNTKFINMNVFPCGYFVDVNNDGKRDLLVAPNQPNVSLNKRSVYHYTNVGADNAPVFFWVTDGFLQHDMIDVGEGSYPVLFDYNADGLTDLLIGNLKQVTNECSADVMNNVTAYKNIGTAQSPAFELDTLDFFNISTQLAGTDTFDLRLTFGDLDKDGDKDMMVGTYNGYIHYFKDTSSVSAPPAFALDQAYFQDDQPAVIDVGLQAAPQFVDMNRDGLLDLVIGERSGNLNYYENIGTPANPLFTLMTDSFGKVDVRKKGIPQGSSMPFFYEYGNKYKLLVGSERGFIYAYDSIDGNLSGKFKRIDTLFQGINNGIRSAVTGGDLDGDGIIELIVGNYRGGLSYYIGSDTSTTQVPQYESQMSVRLFPNPASDLVRIESDGESITQVRILDLCGREVTRVEGSGKARITLDVSDYSSGLYFCEIYGLDVKKLIKLKVVKPVSH